MREIKFRAWNEYKNGKGGFDYISSNYHLDYWASDAGHGPERPLLEFGWNQFTGLLDKNGKEIYEGDILYCKSISKQFPEEPRWIVRVVFEDASFCMGKGGDPLEKYECSVDMEIIGNVYSNPELIKELDYLDQ